MIRILSQHQFTKQRTEHIAVNLILSVSIIVDLIKVDVVTIDWSFDSCDSASQTFFSQLSNECQSTKSCMIPVMIISCIFISFSQASVVSLTDQFSLLQFNYNHITIIINQSYCLIISVHQCICIWFLFMATFKYFLTSMQFPLLPPAVHDCLMLVAKSKCVSKGSPHRHSTSTIKLLLNATLVLVQDLDYYKCYNRV